MNLEAIKEFEANSDSLKNKIIVITGAGSGIGKAAALAFSQAGATVVLLGRTLSKLEAVYDEIEQLGNPKPAILPMNFEGAVEHDYDHVYELISEEFGRLDGILHNAAELGPQTPINNYPLADWQKLIQVNLTAPFIFTKTMYPLLSAAPSASILFTSSGVARQGKAYWGAYSVSKSAGDNLMQVLADENENTTIRVNSIDPGAVRTPMRATTFPAEDPSTVTNPDELMNQYIYLFSDASLDVNGQIILAQN